MAPDVITLVRRENPVGVTYAVPNADELRERIIAGPPDPRVLRTARPGSDRQRWRLFVALATSAVLIVGIALTKVLWRTSPLDAPVGVASNIGPLVREAVPGTARRVTTAQVPGRGSVEIWAADGVEGGTCLGARMNDGTWVGMNAPSAAGSAPGCASARHGLSDEVAFDSGFDYREATFPRRATREMAPAYRVWYGTIDRGLPGHAIRLEDRLTGAATAVIGGRYWAMVVWDPTGTGAAIDPVAYDARGRTLDPAPDEVFQVAEAPSSGRSRAGPP